MNWSQHNSIAASTASSAGTVASALAPRRSAAQVTPKNSTSTNGTSNSNSNSSSSASNSSDITSSDFLTLLVSELQNQDPTQPTDPNQYITQLAQVNSLEQLISINQGIGTLDGAVAAPSSSSSSNSNAIAAVANADAVRSTQSNSGQNVIWGGSTAS